MNAIIGFADLAVKHADDPRVSKEYMEKVLSSGNMLLRIINDILDMSRIESGQVELSENKTNINLIFENVRTSMNGLAEEKGVTLTYEISDIRDRYVYLDLARIERVLVNIISNAIKYTDGGGRVDVKLAQIEEERVSVNEEGVRERCAYYRITCRDNGIGMSKEFCEHAFDEFARENDDAVNGVQGTGLGLALCKKYIQLMGGAIMCQSEKGVGSLFTIILPLRVQEDEEKVHAPKSSDVSTEHVELSGRKVLVVEDNDLNREMIDLILEDSDMVVDDAVDGVDALEHIAKNGPDSYDLVLMDIRMPRMDGYQCAEEIARLYGDTRLPIIALSANAFEEDKARSKEAGMVDHIAKPINVPELMEAIRKAISR